MEAEESPSGRTTGVKGNTLVLRLAKTVAGSLDDEGETFGVDPEALCFFLEEARAVDRSILKLDQTRRSIFQ